MIPFHPLANIFPLIEGPAFDAIVADMKANGFRQGEEIVLLDGMILDGRNRYRAAIAAGIITADTDWRNSPLFVEFTTGGGVPFFSEAEIAAGPLAYVIARNLNRRHLNESQRAMVAARIATMRQGGRQHQGAVSQDRAAEMLNVSPRSLRNARLVVKGGVQQVVSLVSRGDLSISAASVVSRLPAKEQAVLAAKGASAIVARARKMAGRAPQEGRTEHAALWRRVDAIIDAIEASRLDKASIAARELLREIDAIVARRRGQ